MKPKPPAGDPVVLDKNPEGLSVVNGIQIRATKTAKAPGKNAKPDAPKRFWYGVELADPSLEELYKSGERTIHVSVLRTLDKLISDVAGIKALRLACRKAIEADDAARKAQPVSASHKREVEYL